MMPVKGFEGRYSATKDGYIFSHITNKILVGKPQNSGYLTVSLTDGNGSVVYRLVHRLVCEAFNGNYTEDKPFVNHIDGNKTNNSFDNLEWCSRSENMRHAVKNGLMENQRLAVSESNKRRSTPVIGTFDNGSEVYFRSITDARKSGFPKVSDCLLGNRKKTGGATWRKA